jgi:PilZ domain
MPSVREGTTEVDQQARKVPRPRTFFGGRLVFRDGSCSFACVIRELSEAGAKIELPASRLMPQRLFLLTSKKQVAYDAELIWRRSTSAGLKFHATMDLAGCTDPQLLFLRRLSAELCARPANYLSGA